MTSTTPLLLLLDSILSQEPERIREARTRIRQIAVEASAENPSLQAALRAATPLTDDNSSTPNHLLQDVDLLLTAFPDLASVASSHDQSLPLHFAASIGNVPVATRILNQYPAAASKPNTKGKIPLHYAAREGRSDMVAFFLQATPHTAKIASKKRKLALHFAAGDGHTDVVRQLLRVYPRGASLPSQKGKLPIHFAARWGHIQIASDLLYVHPEGVRCVDWDGSLPLHDAAREGQVTMSKFLIERYPVALSVANIRGEIPLFPAVRSGSVDLVILYLQGWPVGGMHILKAVRADDNIQDWDWKIVELCLRGAVDNFTDCPLLEGKEPPAVCCPLERDDFYSSAQVGSAPSSSSSSAVMAPCCRRRLLESQGRSYDHVYGSQESPAYSKASDAGKSEATSGFSGSSTTQSTANDTGKVSKAWPSPDLVPRSKSPILEEGCDIRNSKKRLAAEGIGIDRKRMRSGSCNEGDSGVGCNSQRSRKFIALHAALSCGASSHVIRRVLKTFPEQLSEADEKGQLPLHLAVRNPAFSIASTDTTKAHINKEDLTTEKEEMIKILLEDVLKPHPGAACVTDCRGRLPLHLAIEARAHFSIIQGLLRIHPSSGVDPMETTDMRFNNKPPIYMATEFDCDLSTTFLLLRGDPSVVSVRLKQ